MAEKAAKSGDDERSVVDLQNDERWQERLAEARERRAQALKEQGRDDGARRKPRKPWEEEAVTSRKIPVEPSAKSEKEFDFLDRMDVLKRVTGLEQGDQDQPAHSEPMPGRNWYPGALDKEVDAAPEDPPPPDAPELREDSKEISAPAKPPSGGSVDSIFSDPGFSRDVAPPPVSLLLQVTDPLPPPSSASRPWLERNYAAENVLPSASEIAEVVDLDEAVGAKKKRRMVGWIGVAALFAVAVAVGPLAVFSPWQPRASGPEPPEFGLQPALGFTSPLVGFPRTTSAADWQPPSIVAPVVPIPLRPAFPPAFDRAATQIITSPEPGAAGAGIELLPVAEPLPDLPSTTPSAPVLPLSLFERISADPTRHTALPAVLTLVAIDAVRPAPRPVTRPLTQ